MDNQKPQDVNASQQEQKQPASSLEGEVMSLRTFKQDILRAQGKALESVGGDVSKANKVVGNSPHVFDEAERKKIAEELSKELGEVTISEPEIVDEETTIPVKTDQEKIAEEVSLDSEEESNIGVESLETVTREEELKEIEAFSNVSDGEEEKSEITDEHKIRKDETGVKSPINLIEKKDKSADSEMEKPVEESLIQPDQVVSKTSPEDKTEEPKKIDPTLAARMALSKPEDKAEDKQPTNKPEDKKVETVVPLPPPVKMEKHVSREEEIGKLLGEIEITLNELSNKVAPITEEVQRLESIGREIEGRLTPLMERERMLEEEIQMVEENENTLSDVEEKHRVEEERWGKESQLKETELQKWDIQKELDTNQKEIGAKQAELEVVLRAVDTAEIEKENLEAEIARLNYSKELSFIQSEMKELELEWVRLTDEKEGMTTELEPTHEQETELEERKRELAQQEQNTESSSEKIEVEKERQAVQEELQEVEKKRWGIEQQNAHIEKEIEALKPRYQKLQKKEIDINAKIKEFSKVE